MAMIETWFEQDLKQPVKVHLLQGNVFSQDSQGNLIGVNVFDEGEPAVLSGSVSASVIRADGGTVPVAGTLSGNSCYVILPQAAYAISGMLSIVIKLTGGGSTTTLCAVTGIVYRSSTDAVVDPGVIIPDIQELIQTINDAVASIPLDYSELNNFAHYTASQYGNYEYSFINKSFDMRIVDVFKAVSAINPTSETYGSGSRAVLKIHNIINGKLIICNPYKYYIAVYYRRKTDNEYMGYAQNSTNAACITLTDLNTTLYDYYIMVIHVEAGSETVWTASDLDIANKNIFIYSGEYNDNQKSLSIKVKSNLITEDIIHVGKYYYGAAEPANNPNMAYTELIPINGGHQYFFPYVTIGYSWYESDGTTVIGGNYIAVENVSARESYMILTAPIGASFIGVSVRSGDVPNMVLSELTNSKAKLAEVSSVPVAKSRLVREPLNWIYKTDYKNSMGGSRLVVENGTFDGEKVTLSSGGLIVSKDQICMDKSKTDIIFSIPDNNSPSFILGINGYYANTSLAISDGAIAVWFKSDGSAEIRMGTGESGSFPTVLAELDISDLNITNGRKFVFSIEKDTINKYIVSVYDALTPNVVASAVIQATQNPLDENLYTGQVRGWGGPFVMVNSGGSVEIYEVRMYSTAPTYAQIAIWGDSYVENMGRNPECAYANLLRNALHGNVFISGQGGATALQTSYRLAAEINSCSPQYVILNVGVNDSFNVSSETFKVTLLNLIDMIKANGAVPILITVPNVPAGNATTAAFCNAVNPWIRSLGYDYIDVAYALSTGDGITGDVNKFVADMTHPNLAGGQAIFNYISAHLPHLLWNN